VHIENVLTDQWCQTFIDRYWLFFRLKGL